VAVSSKAAVIPPTPPPSTATFSRPPFTGSPILYCTASTRTEITEQDLELVRHGYDLWNAGDLRGLAQECWTFDIEWCNPPQWPGQRHYHGADVLVNFLEEEVVQVIELDQVKLEQLEVFGDEILIRLFAHTRGQGSELDMGLMPVFHVAHMRDGRVSRVRAYLDEREAVEAAREGLG
jgi:ketosteroid isomerase-like protein